MEECVEIRHDGGAYKIVSTQELVAKQHNARTARGFVIARERPNQHIRIHTVELPRRKSRAGPSRSQLRKIHVGNLVNTHSNIVRST